MAFYDHFKNSNIASISLIGKKIVAFQNNNFINLIKKISHKNLSQISLLEIGPGKGFFAGKCKEYNIKYFAVEGNKLMAKDLKKNGYIVYNQLVPPIKVDKKFDVIFMNQVFEHMENRSRAIKLIESCRKHLKNKGVIIISTPDILSWKEDFWSDYTHNYPTSIEGLTRILYDYNFTVIYKNYYSFFVKGNFLTKIISFLSRLFYGIGIFKLIFGEKAYKTKVSLLRSCIVIGRKN